MENELHKHNIITSPFRDMDIKATRGLTFNTCPECRGSYENTAEHWVIKTYDSSDVQWIVCKAKCGKVDND